MAKRDAVSLRPIIELKIDSRLTDEQIEELSDAPLGQIPTAAWKMQTFLLRDRSVLKVSWPLIIPARIRS